MPEFAWPWIWLLLPLPWLLRAILPAASDGSAVLQVAFLDELQSLAGRRARRLSLGDWRRQWPYLLVWLLLLCAAARPERLGEPLPLPASGRDLLLAVDVSGSMDSEDMQWEGQPISRMALVKRIFGPFIEERQGDRIGLILFGSQAYLQSPLTFDLHTVRTWLDEARVGIAGQDTAIGDAIGLALKRLTQQPAKSRVLVLITDGANTGGQLSPRVAARLAAESGVTLYTLGIGADPGNASIGGLFGSANRLDETSLRRLAETTGGEYFRARDQADLEVIETTLDRLQPVRRQTGRAREAQPLYPWPLAAALLLLGALRLRQERRR